jgi:hypothetical protein
MITPELARSQSNENAWNRLSIYCKRGMRWAIDKGLTQVRLHYTNRHYEYFYSDIEILRSIGFSLETLDESMMTPNIYSDAKPRCFIVIHW